MRVFGKYQFTDYIGPALYVALVLLMTTQLVIITTLGVSFKGKKHSSLVAEPTRKAPKYNGKSPKYNGKPARKENAKRQPTKVSDEPKHTRSCSTGASQGDSLPIIKNPTSWPPVENRLYPDMELYNQDGKKTRLSELSGNVIIVQPVAMTCPLSQAYSGANKNGKIIAQAVGASFLW